MICVILGHTKLPYIRIFYRFHMPLFFILSGYLFHMPKETETRSWIFRRIVYLMVPYFFYFIVVYLLSMPLIHFELLPTLEMLLVGGKKFDHIFGNWWYINVLLVAQILFLYLLKAFQNPKQRYLIYFLLFVLGVLYSNIAWKSNAALREVLLSVPWNLDNLFVVIPYLGIGYELQQTKQFFNHLSQMKSLFVFFSLLAIIASFIKPNAVTIDMKFSKYFYLSYLGLFPLLYGIPLIGISNYLSTTPLKKLVASIGQASMEIMYLQCLVIFYCEKICNKFAISEMYSIIPSLILSILVGILFHHFNVPTFLTQGILRTNRDQSAL